VKGEHPAGEEEDVVGGECLRIGSEPVAYREFRCVVAEGRQHRETHQQRKTHPAKIPDQDRRLQGPKAFPQRAGWPIEAEHQDQRCQVEHQEVVEEPELCEVEH